MDKTEVTYPTLRGRERENYIDRCIITDGLIEKYNKVYTVFVFMGHAFWKENIEGTVHYL